MADVTISQLSALPAFSDTFLLEIEETTVDNYRATVLQLKNFITKIDDLATADSVQAGVDYIMLWDTSANGTRKVTLSNLLTAIEVGDGTTTVTPCSILTFSPLLSVTDAGSGEAEVDVDLTVLTEDLSPEGTDLVLTYDGSGLANKKVTITNLAKTVTSSLSISTLTEETIDGAADYLLFLDDTDGGIKKVLGSNLPAPTVNAYQSLTDGATTSTASGFDTFKLRSADNKLAIAVQSDDITHGDNALFTIDETNFTLANLAGNLSSGRITGLGYFATGTDAANLTGTLDDARLNDTAVAPGTYGDGSNIPVITVDQKGRITGISTVAVVGGGGGGVSFTTNVETLSASKTLADGDDFVQVLDPNGADREIILGTMTTGRIINNSTGAYALQIKETGGGAVVYTLSHATGNKSVHFVQNDDSSYLFITEASYTVIPDLTTNVETLSGTKTLALNDPFTHILDPDGANRDVVLNGVKAGKIFNNSDGTYKLSIKPTAAVAADIELGADLSLLAKGVLFVQLSDGTYFYETIASYRTWDNDEVNVETLSGDVVLTATAEHYQILDPGGAARNVALAARDRGEIVNDSDGTYAITISETDGGGTVATLSSSSGHKYAEFKQKPDGTYYIKTGGSY